MERYARQIMLPEIGEEGQRRLMESSVLVIGLGGLGSPVCQYLTGAGIGRIGLCDSDNVSLSNLQRQTLYGEGDLGCPKTEAARQRLSAMSSATQFDLLPSGLTSLNATDIISGYDVVVDCCDNHRTRYLIDDVCAMLGKPWIYGSIGAFEGRISTFIPGGVRYADIFPDREELSALPPSSGGVVGAVPGIVGAIEAAETVKLICGFGTTLAGRLLTVDIKSMIFNNIEL